MDANRIQEQSVELAQKLASADIADNDYAINQYFEDHARITSDLLSVSGVSKIKKVFKVGSWFAQDGEIIDKPQYDSRSQTIRWSQKNSFVSPNLPASVPLHAQLSGFKRSIRYNLTAHLAANNEDEGTGGVKGQKLYVTKFEVKRWDSPAILHAIPAFIVQPIVSFFLVLVVSAEAFYKGHKGESPGNFILAAFAEIFQTIWGTLLSETGKRQAQADKWRGEKVPQLKQYAQQGYAQASEAASKIQADLESRAKAAGIPVDDYKQRASQAVTDLAENAQARAKAAGIPVEEYRKQAEAAIEDLRKRAGDVGDYLEGKAGEVKEQAEQVAGDAQKKASGYSKAQNGTHSREDSNKVTQDQAPKEHVSVTGEEAARNEQRAQEIRAQFDQVPRTPLGGHDPTVLNAPSFAAAAAL